VREIRKLGFTETQASLTNEAKFPFTNGNNTTAFSL
jgi:hypothetical protein